MLSQDSGASSDCDCGHRLWGLWQGAFDPQSGKLDFVTLRDAQFHLNVTSQLQPPKPVGLTVNIIDFNPAAGTINIDLTIKHPFPNSNLRGFDVRGIVMGPGDTLHSSLDAAIAYPAPTGFKLENADGYSRWWNAVEFTTPGLYGFVPGDLGFKTFVPQATLNPYKYYSDPLSSSDPVVPAVSMTNRGTFSTTPSPAKLTRNYRLQFPLSGTGKPIWLFQYAIDASWAQPTGTSPKPKPIEDFPMEANSPEAFHLDVDTTGTTAYYVDDSNKGGDLILAIEVFDWGAPSNPDSISGEIGSIWVESPTLFDSIQSVELTPLPGSQETSGIYTITIPGVHPTGLEDQQVLVTVRSSDPTTYAPPITGPAYPTGASLAAYALVGVPISDVPPVEYITVDSPNGGEEWEALGSGEIKWMSVGDVGAHVKIDYTIANGTPIPIIASTVNDGSFVWDPIADIDSDQVKIRVTSVEKPTIFDESDYYFTISQNIEPVLTVVYPNGGEELQAGGWTTIQWTSVGPVGYNVKIEYSVSSGAPVSITPFTENDGSLFWAPIPNIESDEVLIIITSIENPTIWDQSDAFFSITVTPMPQIVVVIPNGGEIWKGGGSEEITWLSIGDVGYVVRIDYTINDGPPINIVSTTDNDGSYIWDPIPEINSAFVRVLISSFVFPWVNDASDDFFTIETEPPAQITVLVPNGGEVWQAGGSEEITWLSDGPVGDYVGIDYTVAGSFPIWITSNTENDGSFMWDPIPDIESDEVIVRVSSIDNPTIFDESDYYFTITSTPIPKITVTSPDGGEDWQIGSQQFIYWTSENLTGQVKIEYTLDDLSAPIEIVPATDDTGNYEWNPVPGPVTSTARVIVSSIDSPSVSDSSNGQFTISEPKTLTLISPNGAETLTGGDSWEITWSWTGAMDNMKLLLSQDSGSTWPTTIVDSTPNDGSFTWDPVPELEITTARVRVEWTDDSAIFDESDADFIITTPQQTGWVPISGMELVDLTDPAPFQDDQEPDIAVFSAGADQSRGQIIDQTDDYFHIYNDSYTGTTANTWQYPIDVGALHKFDVLLDGSWIFSTHASSDAWNPPNLNDPTYCVFSAIENLDGGDYTFLVFGDGGTPDPDVLPWMWAVDYSCGVPGGDSESQAYLLNCFSPLNPQGTHTGNILISHWDSPYDNTSIEGLWVDSSTQGGGQGLVDDTNPAIMALAVDDATGLTIGGTEELAALWVLDSIGVAQAHVTEWSSNTVVLVDNQLDSEEYGTATPVDIEFANAKDFGYSVSDNGDFNWLVALLDNGDNTWSIGAWEMDYVADPVVFHEIDITSSYVGVPMSLDVDTTDFEIHVLSKDGANVQSTVLEYIP